MAAKRSLGKAEDAARRVRENEYLRRLVEDAELRDNLSRAYKSGRTAYGRLANGKAPAKVLLEDKKVQKNLREAAEALRDVGDSLRAPRRRRRRLGPALLFLMFGGLLAFGLSEGLRSKVLDALFGAEEEFDYTSTTTPATPAPEPVTTT